MSKKKPLRAAIYTRISDARDGETAGVDRQQKACRERCRKEGWEVVGVYEDNNTSAMKYALPDRKAGRQLVADAQAGLLDVVVVWSSERLYRQVAELGTLDRLFEGIEIASIRSGKIDLSTAHGRAQARVGATFAQWESEVKGERIAAAAEQRLREGRFNGGNRRFGYNANATALEPKEAKEIEWAYKHIANGGSVASVIARWKKTVKHGPSGGKVTSQLVRGTLLRSMNAGIASYKGEEVGKHSAPPIIDEKTYRRVVAILQDPKRRTTKGGQQRLLLSGVMLCGNCKVGKMSGQSKMVDGPKTTRRRVRFYRCINADCHHRVSRRMIQLEQAIVALLFEHIRSNKPKRRAKSTNEDAGYLEGKRLEQCYLNDLDDLKEALDEDRIDTRDYVQAVAVVRRKLDAVRGQLATPTPRRKGLEFTQTKDLEERWETMSIEEQREVINDLIEVIEVGPAPVGNQFSMKGIKVRFHPLP